MIKNIAFTLFLALQLYTSCSQNNQIKNTNMNDSIPTDVTLDSAVFGAGCFWCIEAIFQDFKGVVAVESGYSNGSVKKPTYKEVCTGKTGSAEVAKITFNPTIISYSQLVEIFWHAHNPTTLNRQSGDVGTQYRSAIFYLNDSQKDMAEKSKKSTDESGLWSDPIVTEITELKDYSTAEDYHQNYFNNNPEAGYCSVVIAPKVSKIRKMYSHLLK
jgi:peptide-methionine (S)-S-oxide reductase